MRNHSCRACCAELYPSLSAPRAATAGDTPTALRQLGAAVASAAGVETAPTCCVGAGDTAPLRASMHHIFRGLMLRYRAVLPRAAWVHACAALARVLLTLRPHSCTPETCAISMSLDGLAGMHGRAAHAVDEACVLCSTVLCISEAVVAAYNSPEAVVRSTHACETLPCCELAPECCSRPFPTLTSTHASSTVDRLTCILAPQVHGWYVVSNTCMLS